MIMDASLHTLDIKSPAFVNGGLLPTVYRREGLNMNPGLKVQFIPSETRSLAVVLKDVDAPVSPRIHWVCWPASSPSYRFFKLIQPHVLASGSLLFFSITD